MSRITRMSILAALVILGGTSPLLATIRFVKASATGANDGSSWTNAYTDLQTAIAASSTGSTPSDEIRIAGGTYAPGSSTTDTFTLKNNVIVRGSYSGTPGTEGNVNARSITTTPTILSGEIGSAGYSDNIVVVITCNTITNLARLETCYVSGAAQHGIVCSNASPVFDTVRVTDNVTDSDDGAGLYCENGSAPRFRTCIFGSNDALNGGGVFSTGSNTRPVFRDCGFVGNIAHGLGGVGGGFANVSSAQPTLQRCDFADNGAPYAGGGFYNEGDDSTPTFFDCNFEANFVMGTSAGGGGGLGNYSGGYPTLWRCRFDDNMAQGGDGGGLWSYGEFNAVDLLQCSFTGNFAYRYTDDEIDSLGGNGGGVFSSGSRAHLTMVSCYVFANEARDDSDSPSNSVGRGGGVYCEAANDDSMITLTNCHFDDNQAESDGGGLFILNAVHATGSGPDPTIVNCTFARNVADSDANSNGTGGGVYDDTSANSAILGRYTNCIFWANDDGSPLTAGDSITIVSGSNVTVTHSCVQDDTEGGSVFSGTGNIDLNPQFVSLSGGDHRLDRCSPCIDSGNTLVVPQDSFDIDLDNETTCGSCDAGERTPDRLLGARVVDDNTKPDAVGSIAETACKYCGRVVDMGAYERQLWGDMNHDGVVDGRDIQPFTDCMLAHMGSAPVSPCEQADMDDDGTLSMADVGCLVNVLLGGPGCRAPCVSGISAPIDCNSNDVPDPADILAGTSQDCNHNGIPDECDIANETSVDVDSDGIPDECEPDCNHNGVPDHADIAAHTSTDLNANGVPDECDLDCNHNGYPDDYDIAQHTSDDCNENGVPDECDVDCNSNSIPDDCEIADDPTLDCNEDGILDECEFANPFYRVFDCNDNGIPDSCDIANETSLDCNENGVPDECDIAVEESADENENGIPDECETEGRGGNGPSMPGGGEGGMTDEEIAAAWDAFYEWSAEQEWGPNASIPMSEQYFRYIDKLRELGLMP